MYKGFNINIAKEFFGKKFAEYYKIGESLKLNNEKNAKDVLDKYIVDGIIDGTKLEEEWFQKMKADIFISYSHKDIELVKAIAGWLNKEFKLNVFFDEAIWGQADELLYEIDNKYCLNENRQTYSYEKRNLSTSHVHAMLTVSILKMIDLAEAVFFINTKESIPMAKEIMKSGKNYTMSPWLYQEITMVNNIQKKDLKYYRRNLIFEHSKKVELYQDIKVKYEADLNKLINLNEENLKRWERDCYYKYEYSSLDLLYNLIEREAQ